MSKQLDPLKITTPDLHPDKEPVAEPVTHKFWFMLTTDKQWYSVMREAREWFGPYNRRWRCQSKVRRKLNPRYYPRGRPVVPVWFEVPDPRFATWISVKMSLQVQSDSKYQGGK